MSSSESRKQEVTEQMWCAAEDCSRSVQRRLEKLGGRTLRVGYGKQTVHETKRNTDTFETLTLLDDEVRQRGMTVPGHEFVNQNGQHVISLPWNFQQDKTTVHAHCIHSQQRSVCKLRLKLLKYSADLQSIWQWVPDERSTYAVPAECFHQQH